MAATPQYAVFKFVGAQTGRTYSVDAYISDVADALVRFDAGAGAGTASPDSYRLPEAAILVDVAIVTGMADTKKLQLLAANRPTGDFLRYTLHLDTLATRSPLRLMFQGGTDIRAIQKA